MYTVASARGLVEASLTSGGQTRRRPGHTPDERISIAGLAPGRYRVAARLAGYVSSAGSPEIDVPPGSWMPRGFPVAGAPVVLLRDPAPLESAGAMIAWPCNAVSGADGTFRCAGILPGNWSPAAAVGWQAKLPSYAPVSGSSWVPG